MTAGRAAGEGVAEVFAGPVNGGVRHPRGMTDDACVQAAGQRSGQQPAVALGALKSRQPDWGGLPGDNQRRTSQTRPACEGALSPAHALLSWHARPAHQLTPLGQHSLPDSSPQLRPLFARALLPCSKRLPLAFCSSVVAAAKSFHSGSARSAA